MHLVTLTSAGHTQGINSTKPLYKSYPLDCITKARQEQCENTTSLSESTKSLREQIQEQAKLQSISAIEFARKESTGQQEETEKTNETEWLKKQVESNAHAVQIGQRLAL